jgi:YebC/PmpR family DNA-binding regulatory protein
MSGHSKWAKIKHKKGLTDAKKGTVFTKLGKAITIAAKEGGGDPTMNFALRLAMEKAKAENMPSDNITRAIKRGTGEIEGGEITRISYEAYGPASSALIIDCSTDNTNRTLSIVKRIIETHGGKMAEGGGVSWQFTEKGLFIIKPAKLKKSEKYGVADTYEAVDKDALTMEIMEIPGIEDIQDVSAEDDDGKPMTTLEIYTNRNDFGKVDSAIRNLNVEILSAELVKNPNTPVEVDDAGQEKIDKLVDALDENEDVENVWVNVK